MLDREKHPFYANADTELFLARQDGKVVGRIAAIFDRAHNRFHEESAGFFGFFECIDDQAVADALLGKARNWLKERGAKLLRGPMNPSTNYECGMLIEGFDSSPMVMMTYNPRYYPALMEKAGLQQGQRSAAPMSAHAQTIDLDKIERVADRSRSRANGVTVRPIDMKNFDAEVERVWKVYNAAWERNWGFVPMTQRRIRLHGQGNEADSEARTGTDWRKERAGR